MDEKKYQLQSNPITTTSKLTIYQLSKSGNVYAKEIAEELKLKEAFDKMNIAGAEVLETSVELRFASVNHYVRESGIKNILDLPCGYTPRGIMAEKAGYKYVGCDLPLVLDDMRRILKDRIGNNVSYINVDATDVSGLKAAADNLKGEICITTEGLMNYLSMYEKRSFIDGVRKVLKEHGGCWILIDEAEGPYYIALFSAIFGDKAREKIYEFMMSIGKQSDTKMEHNSFADQNESYEFYRAAGMKIKPVPMLMESIKLKSIEQYPDDIQKRILEYLGKVDIWILTPDPDFKEDDSCLQNEQNDFSIDWSCSAEKLCIKITGRLDSISSPELLASYDKIKNSEKFNSVVFDLKDACYISSAGLRSLSYIRQSLESEDVSIENISDGNMDIFRQTKSDKLFKFI